MQYLLDKIEDLLGDPDRDLEDGLPGLGWFSGVRIGTSQFHGHLEGVPANPILRGLNHDYQPLTSDDPPSGELEIDATWRLPVKKGE